MKDDSDSEKQQQIHHIKNLYAFNLFCQKRFDESMQVFAKLGTGNKWAWPWDKELTEGGESGKDREKWHQTFEKGESWCLSKLIFIPNGMPWVAMWLQMYSPYLKNLVSPINTDRIPIFQDDFPCPLRRLTETHFIQQLCICSSSIYWRPI